MNTILGLLVFLVITFCTEPYECYEAHDELSEQVGPSFTVYYSGESSYRGGVAWPLNSQKQK